MRKLKGTEKRDSDYHEWCRGIVEKFYWTLYGSSFGTGCSVITPERPCTRVDIEEVILLQLEENLQTMKDLRLELASYEFMFKKVG